MSPETAPSAAVSEKVSWRALGIAAGTATLIPFSLVVLGSSLAFDRLVPRPQDVLILLWIGTAAAVVAALTAGLLAAPIHWLLRRAGRAGFIGLACGGAIAGLPAAALWLVIQSISNDPLSQSLVRIWPAAIFVPGLLGGIVYWAASRREQ